MSCEQDSKQFSGSKQAATTSPQWMARIHGPASGQDRATGVPLALSEAGAPMKDETRGPQTLTWHFSLVAIMGCEPLKPCLTEVELSDSRKKVKAWRRQGIQNQTASGNLMSTTHLLATG